MDPATAVGSQFDCDMGRVKGVDEGPASSVSVYNFGLGGLWE